ncbi:MAG: hypothetical protein H6550_16230 [Chitinophagales bacterium]|nr:hypothetical protein [Chitinophagales bacterium]
MSGINDGVAETLEIVSMGGETIRNNCFTPGGEFVYFAKRTHNSVAGIDGRPFTTMESTFCVMGVIPQEAMEAWQEFENKLYSLIK